jgi:predicted nucleic acid-binding protein
VPGYLLDTNHISAQFDNDATFKSRLEVAPPETLFWISAISLGEIEASYKITNRDPEVVKRFNKFLRETFMYGSSENSLVLMIDEMSRTYYAEVVSRIWKNVPPSTGKVRTEAHLVAHGVDINDVWIFSTAFKHNLTLLTTDRMEVIRNAVPEVVVENWLVP